jgi:hypothetical protein
MYEQSDKEITGKKQRDQMLKLVAKGFYNELTNYGVRKDEILWVGAHLLDNLLAQEKKPAEGVEYYDTIFTLGSAKDEWADRKQIAIQQVTLRLLQQPVVSKVIAWLKVAAVRESFMLAFPENTLCALGQKALTRSRFARKVNTHFYHARTATCSIRAYKRRLDYPSIPDRGGSPRSSLAPYDHSTSSRSSTGDPESATSD